MDQIIRDLEEKVREYRYWEALAFMADDIEMCDNYARQAEKYEMAIQLLGGNGTIKIADMLPRESDMENKIKDARQHQEEDHIEFINGYELGYRHCYSWMVRILSLFDFTSQPASSEG